MKKRNEKLLKLFKLGVRIEAVSRQFRKEARWALEVTRKQVQRHPIYGAIICKTETTYDVKFNNWGKVPFVFHDHHRNLHVPQLQGHSLAGNNTVMAKNITKDVTFATPKRKRKWESHHEVYNKIIKRAYQDAKFQNDQPLSRTDYGHALNSARPERTNNKSINALKLRQPGRL